MKTIAEAMESNSYTVLTCGAGVNFTALIIEWVKRGLRKPDLILFADTGSERKSTYSHITVVNNWLLSIGWPQVTWCNAVDKLGNQVKLHDLCLKTSTLPPPAFGFKSCSMRFKVEQVDKFLNNHEQARAVWGSYRKLTDIKNKITRVVGFDAGEDHRVYDSSCNKYDVVFPLVEWDIDRDDCEDIIRAHTLPTPIKSSCYMCPNMRAEEIREMAISDPESMAAALEIEDKFLSSPNAKGRYVKTNVLRRISDSSIIGILSDIDKNKLAYLLGESNSKNDDGGFLFDEINSEAHAYISNEDVWFPSKIRGLGRGHSWRDVLANPELNVGSDMPCMCKD